MKRKGILAQQRKNEDKQEENRLLKTVLDRNMSETEQLFLREEAEADG